MDEAGYPDIPSLCGDALESLRMSPEMAGVRRERVGRAYRQAQVDAALCTGCGNCEEACWYDAVAVRDGLADKGGSASAAATASRSAPQGRWRWTPAT